MLDAIHDTKITDDWGVWTHILVWSLVLLAVAAATMGVLYSHSKLMDITITQ